MAIIIYYYWWGGTKSTRYCGHFWPIVQAPMIDEDDCGAIGGMKIGYVAMDAVCNKRCGSSRACCAHSGGLEMTSAVWLSWLQPPAPTRSMWARRFLTKISRHFLFSTGQAATALSLHIPIQELLGSNLGRHTWVTLCHVLPQSLQAHTDSTFTGSQPFPSESFQIYYASIILPSTWYNLRYSKPR
jgi:hypothetical protein